jgi:hypothetical protein
VNSQPIENRIEIATEQSVDIAIVSLNNLQVTVNSPTISNNPFAYNSFDPSYFVRFDQITSHLVGIGDQVYALGYPMGIASLRTSHPIAKSGYIATEPGKQFTLEIPCQSRSNTLVNSRIDGKLLVVDGLIVPGNSGGPVILPSELKVRREPDSNQLQFADKQTQNYVIGIVSMGLGASGLTLVYSSDYILELIENFVRKLNYENLRIV